MTSRVPVGGRGGVAGRPLWLVVLALLGLPAAAQAAGSVYVGHDFSANVSQYTIDPLTGGLSPDTPAAVAAGSGPVEVAVTPDGKSAYVTNQGNNNVSQYTIDPLTGALSPKTPATVAAGSSPIGVAVTPDGKSAYVANDGDATVAQYTIDPLTGGLSLKTTATVGAGSFPSAVAVTPDGKSAYVTNEGDNTVSQYTIDPLSGALSPDTPATVAAGRRPYGVAVTQDGESAYVTNLVDNNVSQYTIDPLTGALSPKTPATVAAGSFPFGVAVGRFPLAVHSTSTTVNCSPGTVVAGQSTTCMATVTDTASSGQSTPTGTVSFTSSGAGGFSNSGSCTLAGSGASASCSVSYTPGSTPANPVRTDTITAAYGGDSTHTGSNGTTTVQVISPTSLPSGAFAIGDQDATVGSSVTFWGAQWSSLNSLSGGPAPASFRGFASHTPNNPPQCSDHWTSEPGNSSSPPVTVPEYMELIASGAITKSGATIAGDTKRVVVVKTNPGYGPNPGDPGTGTVVAQVCQS